VPNWPLKLNLLCYFPFGSAVSMLFGLSGVADEVERNGGAENFPQEKVRLAQHARKILANEERRNLERKR
jgi:hypothetical protein